jgi:predicted MPP superfamily phosphohydrolase
MKKVFANRKPIDVVTVADELDSEGKLDKVGGYAYLNELTQITPSAANYQSYYDIITRDSTNRKLIRAARKIVENSMSGADGKDALAFAEKAMKIAPCYYVTGNHESRTSEYRSLKQGLIDLGVKVLEDEKVEITRMSKTITLIGVNDPAFSSGNSDADIMQNKLHGLARGEDYTVLLSHRPELFDVYVQNGVDLVLSGHAHGGQFRVPFLGGLVAPNQGLFPQYDGGVYKSGKTTMIVSRGIGNSAFPFRINNRPELVIVELKI